MFHKIFKMLSRKKKKNLQQDEEFEIKIDTDTDKPSTAWERLRLYHSVKTLSPDTYLHKPREENSLRFVCLSDTHAVVENKHREFDKRIPDGDVLIHCGDFTMAGDPSEIEQFDHFMSRLPHPVKLVIAGNHEMTFEKNNCCTHPTLIRQRLGLPIKAPEEEVVRSCKELLQHLLYLEDETVTVCGIKIYGSPWVPQFGSWGFSLRRGHRLLEIWNQIPSDTNILVTHGPPCGYGDMVPGDKHAGCVELLNTVVYRVKPKFHVFGHIHTGYGMWTNGKTAFINSAICSDRYRPDNNPIVFDFPLPKGYTREDFALLSTEKLRQARKISTNAASGLSEDGEICGAASLDEAANTGDSLDVNGDATSSVDVTAFAQHQSVQEELLKLASSKDQAEEDVEAKVAAMHLQI